MKIIAHNVIEWVDGEIVAAHSFSDTREGELAAIKLFEELIREVEPPTGEGKKMSLDKFIKQCIKQKCFISRDQNHVITLIKSLP
ncbi:MAG TPA: hypothetical protein PKX15_03395 [Bacteroidales bacterium]|nr:hypothetical protein [Bacteroidales bacterium]